MTVIKTKLHSQFCEESFSKIKLHLDLLALSDHEIGKAIETVTEFKVQTL